MRVFTMPDNGEAVSFSDWNEWKYIHTCVNLSEYIRLINLLTTNYVGEYENFVMNWWINKRYVPMMKIFKVDNGTYP